MQRIDKELESALATLEKEKEEALKDLDSQVQHSCLQLFQAVSHGTLGLNGHLGMRVSVTSLTPKLMHMLHDFAYNVDTLYNVDFTVTVADAAVSVSTCSL